MSAPTTLPTEAELEILQVLWDAGPSTVRQVYERLVRGRAVGYTTVLKLLQIMHAKELVTRDESTRTHVYTAAAHRAVTQHRLIRDLAERAFGGSAARLMLRALPDVAASAEEKEEIRALLRRLEEG